MYVMDNTKLQKKQITKISPLIQSTPNDQSVGFIGYTIQYEDWGIENKIYPYDSQTRLSLLKHCIKEHCKLQKQHQESTKGYNKQKTLKGASNGKS